jgi:hypothetical protein
LVSSKTYYSTDKVLKDYKQKKYYENLISGNRNNYNPNLNFDTPINFKKKLEAVLNKNYKKEKEKEYYVRPMSVTHRVKLSST